MQKPQPIHLRSADNPHIKAQVLAEVLPSLRTLVGTTLVLKYGGSVIEESVYAESILTDLAFLQQAGVHVVVVHGGGKAISSRMREEGIVPKFVGGLRYTDKKTIVIVESVLNTVINPQIVSGLKSKGAKAEGVPGKKVLSAKKLVVTVEDGTKADLGYVGEVSHVTRATITNIQKKGAIPVITPVALGPGNIVLNINADIAAAKVAAELKANYLTFLSDVNGILEDPQHPDSTLAKVSQTDITGLRNTGVISGGMIPKVTASVDALKKGVKRVKFLNGQLAHSVLVDMLLDSKIGTEIIL